VGRGLLGTVLDGELIGRLLSHTIYRLLRLPEANQCSPFCSAMGRAPVGHVPGQASGTMGRRQGKHMLATILVGLPNRVRPREFEL
jgi:hypothetical protein